MNHNEYTEYELKIQRQAAAEHAEGERKFQESRRGFLAKAGLMFGALSMPGFMERGAKLDAAPRDEAVERKRP